MNKFFTACSVLLCATGAQAAIMDTYQVGTGLNTSTVQIDFQNGNGYLFEVSWQGEGTTGWDLMTTIADEIDGFALDYSTSEWGVFLMGITAFDDYDWGTGAGWQDGIEDYWHYWTAIDGRSLGVLHGGVTSPRLRRFDGRLGGMPSDASTGAGSRSHRSAGDRIRRPTSSPLDCAVDGPTSRKRVGATAPCLKR